QALLSLGKAALASNDTKTAAEQLGRAIDILSRLAPGTTLLAEALHESGLVSRRAGQPAEAAGAMLAALDALESADTRIGGSEETRLRFGAAYAEYYQDAADQLL